MKIKTSELDGAQLDYAVAKCEEWEVEFEDGPLYFRGDYFHDGDPCKPSTNWGQGGPIIEREVINLGRHTWDDSGVIRWGASKAGLFQGAPFSVGPTPLIAAMRCYVASKLGEEVAVPEELLLGGEK